MKNNRLKAVLLTFAMVITLLPLTLFAQRNDAFIGPDDVFYGDRLGESFNITLSNFETETPLTDGLAILLAAGAGYVVLKRKKSKILLILVLLIGFTQCKKSVVNDVAPNNVVHITLDVGEGSKVIVTPPTLAFESGDVVYVGNNNNFVGTLNYDGSKFSGTISGDLSDYDYLHFYLIGGKGFTPDITGNTAVLDISDQTAKLPIIAYAHSVGLYHGEGVYNAKLKNKCAVAKFIVTRPSASDWTGVCVKGLNNKVSIDFSNPFGTNNGIIYDVVNDGAITMASGDEVFAILLPQEEMSTGANGSVVSGRFCGSRPALPQININKYYESGFDLNITTDYFPEGVLEPANSEDGLFSVSTTKKVRFAKGNLKAVNDGSWATWTWDFMDNQYDRLETNATTYCTADYADKTAVSLMGWGTSGFNLRGTETNYYFRPYNTNKDNGSYYGPSGNYGFTGANVKGDWGYYVSSDNAYKQWRTLTKDEWAYLFKISSGRCAAGVCFVKATINAGGGNDVSGVILFPDNWDPHNYAISSDYYNKTDILFTNVNISLSDWVNNLEAHGAVFLPAAGRRTGVKVEKYGTTGEYWTASSSSSGQAYIMSFDSSNLNAETATGFRYYGRSVRLVCE